MPRRSTARGPVLADAASARSRWRANVSAGRSGEARCKVHRDGAVTGTFKGQFEGDVSGSLSCRVDSPINTAQYLPTEAELSFRFRLQLGHGSVPRQHRLSIHLFSADGVQSWQTIAAGPKLRAGRWQKVALPVPLQSPEPELRNIYGGHRVQPGLKEIRFVVSAPDRIEASVEIAEFRLQRQKQPEPPYEAARRVLPAKRRGALVLSTTASSFYRAEEIARRLLGEQSVDVGLFRSNQLPLTFFPASFHDLSRYGLVILADVDPFKIWQLGKQRLRDLCDYVVSGGGLLLVGGQSSFGCGRHHDLVAPFLHLLPVSIKSEADIVEAKASRRRGGRHAITEGLRGSHLGRVGRMHDVKARVGSEVLLTVDDRPLLVTGKSGDGRVCVLTAIPDVATQARGHFFSSRGYEPLLERAIRWCAGRDLPRRAEVPVGGEPAASLKVQFPYGKDYVEQGRDVEFAIAARSGRSGRATVAAVDAHGTEVHRESVASLARRKIVRIDGSSLKPGKYLVRLAARSGIESEAEFHVVKRIDRTEFFPIIGTVRPALGPGLCLDEAGVEREVDDLIAHNVNTVALSGLASFGKWGKLSYETQMKNHAERYALLKGMAIHYEYEQLPLVPGRTGAGSEACPNSPGYRDACRKRLRKLIDVAMHIPNLLMIDPWDEPSAGWGTMDACEHCRAHVRQKYRSSLPRKKSAAAASLHDRRIMQNYVNDCLSRTFREVHRYKREVGATFKIFLNYCYMGLSAVFPHRFTHALDWSGSADCVGCDYYPYWYPSSTVVRFNDFHYGLSHLRSIARHHGQEFGFYVELDDRNYPVEAPHLRASNECAYTALAHGAHFLSLFIHVPFGAGTREERWDVLGREFGKISRAAPLLAGTHRPAAPVAILFPYTDFTLSSANQRVPSSHGYELLLRAVGDCDVINEGALSHGGLDGCRALFVPRVTYLSEAAHQAICDFVHEGGIVCMEGVPERNECGDALEAWRQLYSAARERQKVGPVTLRLQTVGAGLVAFAEEELFQSFHDLVEYEQLEEAAVLWQGLGDFLRGHGVAARATCDHSEVEVAVRGNRDRQLVVIASHVPEEADVSVCLAGKAKALRDCVSGKPVSAACTPTAVRFKLRLAPYEGRILQMIPGGRT